ncbi:N-acetylglucosamine-6-phosphate deacetylase [Actinobaculum suis]|uniref:N-acetylglucosamine-6-phosphate deacetylase n=1 Tax=Actinobaculum suis TaxID=1657 RepID=UPI00080A2934|nr:amidohydrolase family protein [Actinobaculum suis]OCA94879.1 N-acetylglucosamine-6-phosphate deacetylase [Actinobaculum suis]
MEFRGTTFDGYGREVGHGLRLNSAGELSEVLEPTGPGAPVAHTPAPAATSTTETTAASAQVVSGAYIVPGVVDVHCHGGGGFGFSDDYEPAQIETAIATHLAGGTTAMFASLVSLADPLPQIHALVPYCEAGHLAGIHLEGPYISVEKKGAQNPAVIRDANLEELRSWLEAGRGWIKTMTIAPETGNAREAAKLLLEYGAVPSWGHTNADGETARELLEVTITAAEGLPGLRNHHVPQTATHLFNAMPGIQHRAPGPVREYVQAARRGEIAVELIADSHHLSADLVEDVYLYLAGPACEDAKACCGDPAGPGEAPTGEEAGTCCGDAKACCGDAKACCGDASEAEIVPGAFFVTDSLAAAGLGSGQYKLGGLDVEIRDGVCYLLGTNSIAGGASVLADQLGLFARRGRLSLPQAIRACVAGPVRALGLDAATGVTLTYEPGKKPNFLVLDEEYRVIHVVREGELITGR